VAPVDGIPAGRTLDGLGGYVLAGGRSSRMGTDKALLQLAGRPLIAHAVAKLRRICSEVHILSGNPQLAEYAPLVPDIHPGIGPIGGIEAALSHTAHDWNLIYPVDVPFIPTAFLQTWTDSVLGNRLDAHVGSVHVAYFEISGIPQPTVLMVRRCVLPFLRQAIARGDFKLIRVLEIAARELAPVGAPSDQELPFVPPIPESPKHPPRMPDPVLDAQAMRLLTPAQRAAQPFWFNNLNTPEDFAEAEAHVDALDP
jgi:molybdopterin-guanine dinucleotide biosynthesis protein A